MNPLIKSVEKKAWPIVIVTAIGLLIVAAGVGVAQKPADSRADAAHSARALSDAFRQAAKNALPSIVSITARGKSLRLTSDDSDIDENSPFGELFRRQPELREFFRREHRHMPAPEGKGAGFIVDPRGTIITNSHVVRNADAVIVKLYDGREFTAANIKTDPRSDVAVLHIDAGGPLKAIPLGDSDAMQIGDWVLAVGSPFGFDLTVTAGIVSAKGRGPGINDSEDYIQTDAAINPGNSGGPLLNLDGEVIGLNTAISTRSGGYDGIGFAIPSNMARWVVDQLTTSGQVKRAFLGVSIQPLDSELAKRFKTRPGQGALVTGVMPNSAAANAGLKPGDVILQLNKRDVDDLRGLIVITEKLTIGEKYPMNILRDGKEMMLTIAVQEMPKDIARTDESASAKKGADAPAKESFDQLGLQTQELTAEIAERLGVDKTSGVVISAVEPDSPADEAGLEPGYVIQQVGTTKVASPEQFKAALEKQPKDAGVLLLVRTRTRPEFVIVKP